MKSELSMKMPRSLCRLFEVGTLAGAMLMTTGCQDEKQGQLQIKKDFDATEARSIGGPRIHDILMNLSHECLTHSYWNMAVECYPDGGSPQPPVVFNHFRVLAKNNIGLELTTRLPQGAVLQIAQDRILLNSQVPVEDLYTALPLAIDYIVTQLKDHMPVGTCESFTIGSGKLVPVSKNTSDYEKILIPVEAKKACPV